MPVNYKGFSSVPQIVVGPITADPASIPAASVALLSLTVPGSTPDMHFIVTAPSLVATVAIGGAYCTTAGTVVVRLINPTAAAIDPVSQSFYVLGL